MKVTLKWNDLGTSHFQVKARNFKEFRRKVLIKRRLKSKFYPHGRKITKSKRANGLIIYRVLNSHKGYNIISRDSKGLISEVVLKPGWEIFLPQWKNKPTTLTPKIQTALEIYLDNIDRHEQKHLSIYIDFAYVTKKNLLKGPNLKKSEFIKIVTIWEGFMDMFQDIFDVIWITD